MSTSKWFKNKETGEVVYREGYTQSEAVVVRSRDRTLKWVRPIDFRNWYTPTNTSGFTSLKPKTEFKPRYATYHLWSEGEAFVKEFEPGKFKVIMKDGDEVVRPSAWKYFKKFFEDGSWTVVSEEEALARLDKPKPKFNPYSEYYEKVGFFAPGGYTDKRFAYYEYVDTVEVGYLFAGYRTVEFVENLFRLGVLTTEPQRKPVDVAKELKAVIDRSPKLQSDLAKMLRPKKILVEWAVSLGTDGPYVYELYPEGRNVTLPNSFKTGRTVEVPQ